MPPLPLGTTFLHTWPLTPSWPGCSKAGPRPSSRQPPPRPRPRLQRPPRSAASASAVASNFPGEAATFPAAAGSALPGPGTRGPSRRTAAVALTAAGDPAAGLDSRDRPCSSGTPPLPAPSAPPSGRLGRGAHSPPPAAFFIVGVGRGASGTESRFGAGARLPAAGSASRRRRSGRPRPGRGTRLGALRSAGRINWRGRGAEGEGGGGAEPERMNVLWDHVV